MLASFRPGGMPKGRTGARFQIGDLGQVLAVSSLCLDSKDKAKRASASSTRTSSSVWVFARRVSRASLISKLGIEPRYRQRMALAHKAAQVVRAEVGISQDPSESAFAQLLVKWHD
jgi:hypothetical protein